MTDQQTIFYLPVTLQQLQKKSAVNPSDMIFIGDANGNLLFKTTIQQLVQNSGVSFSGNIAGIAKTDTVPATAAPTSQIVYFGGAGTYNLFPGSDGQPLVLTENLNVISWDGTKAAVQEVPVNVDVSALTPNGGYTGTSNILNQKKFNISDINKKEGVNLFNPTSLLAGKLLLCSGGLTNDSYDDAKTGVIEGLEEDVDYYIQGRVSRNSLAFYDRDGNILPPTNGADYCAGPADGVYHSPIGAYKVIFSIFWNDTGANPNNIMFFKGTAALPSYVPYIAPVTTGLLDIPLAAELIKYGEDYKTIEGILNGTFVIGPGSANIFDPATMVRTGYSINQTSGGTIPEPDSECTTLIPLKEGETHITVAGRTNGSATTGTNSGIVFYDANQAKIDQESYGGEVNRTVVIPVGAKYMATALSYSHTADSNKDTMMIVYGEVAPDHYIPYEPDVVSGVKIRGITYPLANGGVNPGTSSFKFQGVRWDGSELVIVSKYSDVENLLTVFKPTGNNNTFLPNGQWLITRENNEISVTDFDKYRDVNRATTRWFGTDGIGPVSVQNVTITGFEAGNHGAPEPANPTPPYYNYATSNTLSFEIWVDGSKMQVGDIADAKVITVKVINEVYNCEGFYSDPVVYTVDFHEMQTTHVIGGQLLLRVDYLAMRDLTLKTIYGLQMQLGGLLTNIYFPHSLYNGVDPANVNPSSGDRSYGTFSAFPDFEKFLAINGDNTKATCVWIDTSKGLGTRSGYMNSTSPIARGKLGKLYHNLVAKSVPMTSGQTLSYYGSVVPFLNLSNTPADNTFAYIQYEPGTEPWEYNQYLYCDFAGEDAGREILINYPDLLGKTLEVVKSDATVTLPGSLVVTEEGILVSNTGHGNVKFLIP